MNQRENLHSLLNVLKKVLASKLNCKSKFEWNRTSARWKMMWNDVLGACDTLRSSSCKFPFVAVLTFVWSVDCSIAALDGSFGQCFQKILASCP
mmetsp:Transcript_15899/g.31078  ORF Transcript_15899/g.31078 Transcript_15899/m.31078 type:complete len:94 (-) Transcript_15899:55-336(-)